VPLHALLFDFDGLILDTESAARSGWQWAYREHGFELPEDKWALLVGTVEGWDPARHLEELVGRPIDHARLDERRRANELTLIEAEQLRPGVLEYLAVAERLGLKRAIVSSATRTWIDSHLVRLECAVGWDAIVTADLDAERAKPRPTLYLEALELLRVPASEAVAFEDSPNGAAAARAAGIFVVGVPNAVTRTLGLDQHADLVVDSLADLPPDDLLAIFDDRAEPPSGP
jgi:HAD superfamily hydrolase (TIGR01509 family)